MIEPCGFPWRDRDIRRVALDYHAEVVRHRDWDAFQRSVPGRRVLLTTSGGLSHSAFAFRDGDVLLLGNESGGVPPSVHEVADARVRIPLAPGARSLNVATAGAIALAEASRQLGLFAID